MTVNGLLEAVPPLLVYLIVGGVIAVENLGVPLPGEIVLVSAALLASRPELGVSPCGSLLPPPSERSSETPSAAGEPPRPSALDGWRDHVNRHQPATTAHCVARRAPPQGERLPEHGRPC